MAHVTRLYPGIHFGVGPAIESGLLRYRQGSSVNWEDDLPAAEKEIKKIISQNYPIVRRKYLGAEALELLHRPLSS